LPFFSLSLEFLLKSDQSFNQSLFNKKITQGSPAKMCIQYTNGLKTVKEKVWPVSRGKTGGFLMKRKRFYNCGPSSNNQQTCVVNNQHIPELQNTTTCTLATTLAVSIKGCDFWETDE
jgi:hypothetical protein